ncbi:MAG: hypothetical protein M0P22_09965 [Methanoculleus sp.]|nr:hypothetical protein [Methanoculleus sp.]
MQLGRLLLASVVLVLCIGMVAPLASALPDPGENGTGGSVDGEVGDEKPAIAKLPVIPVVVSDPVTVTPAETPAPEETDEKAVMEREPVSLITGATTSPPGEVPATTEPVPTASLEPALAATVYADDSGDEDPDPTATVTPSPNSTVSLEPTTTATVSVDDSDDEEPEETTGVVPTLAKYAPPRASATMAKAHYSHDRPLVQSGHQIVSPASPSTSGVNETATTVGIVEPHDGLIVKGVGVLLARTPEDVALTRSGVEIANLDWLLDPAMRLGGRHPRAAFEGETFTVTVTVEARNLTVTGEDPAYVVLVPPPGETGVYEITRTREPRSLRDGERGVWEFLVTTRTGRLTLADLTLPEERLVTNLTSNPDLFAFRAYALAGTQEIPSTGVSDPILAIRPDGSAGIAEASSLPELYTFAGIPDSTLRPSETMAGAWTRGIGHDAIVAGAVGHLGVLENLGKEEVGALYAAEEKVGAGEVVASSSPLDSVMKFFQGLFGWFGETLHLVSP